MAEDPRIAEAKRKGMTWVMQKLQLSGLRRAGAAEHVGPCPVHGGDDTFGINTRKEKFICRKGDDAGDAIRLVRHVLGLDFEGALDWICGARQEISAAEQERRDQADADNKKRKDREAEKYRAKARGEGHEIWMAGRPAEDSPVRDYLALRGITQHLLPALPKCLRYHPDLAYMAERSDGTWVEAHRGPAMLAAVQSPDDRFSAVHRTWFDLTAPQGKLVILHPETGKSLSRKKSWGPKKGCAIRLHVGTSTTLVMGEGNETTLTALVSGRHPDAHFWAGVDMGNMSGQRRLGRGLQFAGIPDLEDLEAFVPPSWVTELIFVQDGDSEPRVTRAKMLAGLRRAMVKRPGLRAWLACCPLGSDLNDVLLAPVDP